MSTPVMSASTDATALLGPAQGPELSTDISIGSTNESMTIATNIAIANHITPLIGIFPLF